MRHLKILYLATGLIMLALVAREIELAEVVDRALAIGWGMAALLGLYFAAFVIDSFTWQMALTEVPLSPRWLYRTWKVRMVGEVFNAVLPAAGMGGEPVKAVLLKRYYGIGYRAGGASLILGKTINMLALVIFLIFGFALMVGTDKLPLAYKTVSGAGLVALGAGTFLFFAVQRFRITSLAGTWLARFSFAARLDAVLHHIHDMDERLVHFYARHKGRLLAAISLALVNWLIGVAEIYCTMIFLDRPISWGEAWIVEAAVQLVRAGAFFIPAGIGAQEGVFLLVFTAITGSSTLGVSVALIRRLREILWLLWGTLLGSMFTFQPRHQGGDGKD